MEQFEHDAEKEVVSEHVEEQEEHDDLETSMWENNSCCELVEHV